MELCPTPGAEIVESITIEKIVHSIALLILRGAFLWRWLPLLEPHRPLERRSVTKVTMEAAVGSRG